MHDSDIQAIITACRVYAARSKVVLPPITIDKSTIARCLSEKAVAILTNKSSNMAAQAIASANTMEPPNWEPGKVICISDAIVAAHADSMTAIGVIVHEMGHAYNIAAELPNTETNAHIFEIEMLLQFRGQDTQLDAFFKERVPQYLANTPSSHGYVRLHETIRSIPKLFTQTHETYDLMVVSHFNTHKKRGSKQFSEAMEALHLADAAKTCEGIDPAKNYPLIKMMDKLPFFSRTASYKRLQDQLKEEAIATKVMIGKSVI